MTVSSGFFNGADRPSNASEICSMFDGVITDGIFSTIGDLFVVLAAGGNNISIGSGKAWFHHSWLKNDATIIKEAEAAEVLLNRIDIVVLEFDSSDPVRDNNIKIIKGTPATNPVSPELSNGPLKFQHKIAEISRNAGSTEILQINITPFQGTSGTPLVTGLVQQADITTILQQFANEMIDLQDQYEDALRTLQENGISAHAGNHSKGNIDAISTLYPLNVPSVWSGSSAPYTQEISVPGLISGMIGKVDIVFNTLDSISVQITKKEAWLLVDRIDIDNDKITLVCFDEKPSVDFDLQMEVIK